MTQFLQKCPEMSTKTSQSLPLHPLWSQVSVISLHWFLLTLATKSLVSFLVNLLLMYILNDLVGSHSGLHYQT